MTTTTAPARTSGGLGSMAQMVHDALRIHDEGCCTADRPCGLRDRLELMLPTYELNERPDHDVRDAEPKRGKGGQQATSTRPGKLASEKQLGYLSRLFEGASPDAREDVAARHPGILGPTRAFTGQTAAGPISSQLASSLIEILQGKGAAAPAVQDATPKQLDLIRKLAGEKDVTTLSPKYQELVRKVLDGGTVSKLAASPLLDALFAAPRSAQPQKPAQAALEAGIYELDGDIFKVQAAVHGSGKLYAKVLIVSGHGEARFEYAAGAIRKLRPEHRMSLEAAQKFGVLYGVCIRCSKTLTDEESIERGMGATCASKGWG